jgi:glycosyltransferase involved in cell wall biosynthesis
MLDDFNFYSKNFEKVYIKSIDDEKFKDLPKNVEHIPFPKVPLKKYFYLLFAGILNYREVDCVEAFGNATSVIPALPYKLMGKKIYLYHKWDLAEALRSNRRYASAFFVKILQIFAFRIADTITVTTDRVGNEPRKYSKKDNVFLLPNYVDVDSFKRTKTKKIHNLLVFVGRLHPDKNLGMLLDAMKELPQFKLWIIGGGPLRGELTEIRKKNNLKNVEFLGVKPYDELPKYLNKAEAFILVSHREGQPKALLEAMACELPCIGTDVAGINDVLINEKTGLLCKKTTKSIRESILNLFQNREKMKEIGRNGREFVVKNYSRNKVLERGLELLLKTCNVTKNVKEAN